MNVQCRFIDGFSPTWDVYVRWPGYKNRKYFTSISAWKKLPSQCESIVKDRIDVALNLAWMDITTASYGTHRYLVKGVMDEGSFSFREKDLEGHSLRFNNKEHRVEFFNPDTENWDIYISDEEITQIDTWNRS